MTLGDRMIRYRAENNLTQSQLAALCKISRPTVCMIEKYGTNATALTRAKIELVIGEEEKEE